MIAFGVLIVVVLSMLAAVYRARRGPDSADRALSADLVFYGFVAMVVLVGTMRDDDAAFTIAVIATLVGFLATLSLARLVTGGKR
ncbi:monovalent cation/H+ antiporter complex subunit F [Georgenia satyanarayanai]|uniref:monovalent cation/H+ antiporter complex subunit F n=1 Tax=Georgenia satyanarayanai TaxID=860221 RepID=UPI001265A8AE|nr:monovalent cation/H+ antiporter complex subunit F [Georgenia satyanarayanai]